MGYSTYRLLNTNLWHRAMDSKFVLGFWVMQGGRGGIYGDGSVYGAKSADLAVSALPFDGLRVARTGVQLGMPHPEVKTCLQE